MFWSSRLASPCLQSSSPLSWLNFFKWLSVRPMGNCQCFEGFGFPSKKELNVGTTGGCGLAVAWYGRNLGIRALFQSLYGRNFAKASPKQHSELAVVTLDSRCQLTTWHVFTNSIHRCSNVRLQHFLDACRCSRQFCNFHWSTRKDSFKVCICGGATSIGAVSTSGSVGGICWARIKFRGQQLALLMATNTLVKELRRSESSVVNINKRQKLYFFPTPKAWDFLKMRGSIFSHVFGVLRSSQSMTWRLGTELSASTRQPSPWCFWLGNLKQWHFMAFFTSFPREAWSLQKGWPLICPI